MTQSELAPDRRYLVPAVVSAARILGAIGQAAHDGRSLTELAHELELSKSSAHNLLVTLEELGYVQRDPDSRRFRLGAALVPLGHLAARNVRLVALMSDRVGELAAGTGLSIAVGQITDAGEAQIVARAYPPEDVHVGVTLGSRFGRLDGAIGKCLLADLPAAEAAAYVADAEIPEHTRATITSPRRLLREVDAVRARGWAASLQEFNENHAVSVPVLGPSGRAEAVLVALGFAGQLPKEKLSEVGERLRAAADEVTAAAGGPETYAPANQPTTGPSRAQEASIA